MRLSLFNVLFSLLGSVMLFFIIFTLFNMMIEQIIFSPEDFLNAVGDPAVIRSITLTMYASFLATLISIIFGTPLAYLLARHRFPLKSLIESIIDVPVIIPHSVAGIALYALLMRRSVVGMALANLGLIFEDSLWGIVAAMLFVSFSFYLNAAKEGFQSVNPHLEYVARTLGASPWRTFLTISLPLTARHLFSGALMAWARGISEFGAVIFLAFYPMVASVLIYSRFTTYGLRGSRPIAVLLILICFTIFIALRLLSKRLESSK